MKNLLKVIKTLDQAEGVSMLGSMKKAPKFKILISTILSARAKDEVTLPVTAELMKRYPTPKALSVAKRKDVEKIIKRIGFYRNKAKNVIQTAKIIHKKYRGKVPDTMAELLELPGVGRKVAGCVMVYAHGKNELPVDTHVHRISNRLGWVKTKTPHQTEDALKELVPKKYWYIMNEILVIHGQNICVPISPFCSVCPVRQYCKRVGVTRSR